MTTAEAPGPTRPRACLGGCYLSSRSAFLPSRLTSPGLIPGPTNSFPDTSEINYLFSVPTLYQAIVSPSNYKPEKMASLDLVLYGGAPIMPALLDRIDREWPAAVRHIYGTPKSCALSTTPSPWDGR